MYKCDKCKEKTGMFYERQYKPEDYLHGKRNSKVWIIGLNPKGKIGFNDITEKIENLEQFDANHSYFQDFKNVSGKIYENFGKENGVVHVDFVKCFSNNFPPVKLSKNDLHSVLCNCRTYLFNQLETYQPKVIICNGIHVNYHIKDLIPVKKDCDFETFYIGDFINEPVIFLSGFIGRNDNFAKRRLGKEIESKLNNLNLLM